MEKLKISVQEKGGGCHGECGARRGEVRGREDGKDGELQSRTGAVERQ